MRDEQKTKKQLITELTWLRESDARLRAMLQAVPDMILSMSGDGTFLEYKSPVEFVPLAPPEEFIGRDIGDVLPPAVAEPCRQAITTALDSGEVQLVEYSLNEDGAARDYEARIVPVGENEVVVLVQDVTDHKATTEALKQRESAVRLITEQMPAILWTVNRDLEFTSSTGAGLKALGLKPNEVLGMSLYEYFRTADSNSPPIAAHKRAIAGDTVSYDFSWDGQVYRTCVQPLCAPDGSIEGAVGIALDTTELKRAEEELIKSQERWASLWNNIPDNMTELDLQGTIVNTNHIGRRVERTRLLGSHFCDHVPYDQREQVRAAIDRVIATGEAEDHETGDYTGADGRWWSRRFIPLKRESRITGLIVIETEITDRKRTEEALRQAQKLESLASLAGGIAHDFNNLLMGVLGNAGLVLMEMSPLAPNRDRVEDIEKAAHRAAELTKQLLAYSGKGRFVVRAFNVNDLLHEIGYLLETTVSKTAALKFRLAETLPPIEADTAQIRQVVMNLVTNASDALGDRAGEITIATRTATLDRDYLSQTFLDDALPAGEYVVLSVSDNGPGIEEANLPRIFDPFFTTRFTGRGLGLAAVLGIVRGHRGAIKVDTEVGQGTVMEALFPVAVKRTHQPDTDPKPSDWQGQGKILLIDDEETVRAVCRTALEKFGFTVLSAADGEEGVDLYRRHSAEIRAVVLDMTMPRLDGLGAFRQIREIDPRARVLLMSGYNEQEATREFAGQGLSGFIQKPHRPAELVGKVREVLGEGDHDGRPDASL